jgi:pimeloyl-ACP methyl ester carboxylesterase
MRTSTPMLFFPGASGRKDFWAPVAERLADLGPAELLGYPGFGGVPPEPGIGSLGELFDFLLGRLPPGPCHVVAQSMGGVLAARLAIEHPGRVGRLVLVATSGGVDVAKLGGAEWRQEYRASLPDVPRWFEEDRTNLTAELGRIRAPTLVVSGDADPVSPVAVGELLAAHIPGARRVVVPGGTHMLAVERADEVSEVLRAFLVEVASLPEQR